MSVVDDGSRGGTPGPTREGEETEAEEQQRLHPTNPGKPEGSGASPALIIFAILAVLVLGVAIGSALLIGEPRPTPDEFCADHGGVRYLSAGGWGHADTATCEDGHAGEVYP